jgi:hypothetical protein
VTREAVMAGFDRFVGDAIEETAAEFSVSRALRQGIRGPGGKTVDGLLKNSDLLWDRVVQPELDSYREQTVTQFDILLDWVETDAAIEQYRREILDAGSFVDSIRDDIPQRRRRAVEDTLLAHHEALGEAVEPLVETPEDDFWTATQAVLTVDEARELIEEHFAFTGPVREHRDAFEMVTAIDPSALLGGLGGLLAPGSIDIEYTDEAIRSMRRAEQAVITEANRELDRRFEG